MQNGPYLQLNIQSSILCVHIYGMILTCKEGQLKRCFYGT